MDDYDAIKKASGISMVRGYAAADCDFAKNALPAARAKGFKVMLGIWYDSLPCCQALPLLTLAGPMSRSRSTMTWTPSRLSPRSTPTRSTP